MISKSLKITSYFVRILGVFLILFSLLAITESFINMAAMKNFGELGIDHEWLNGSDSLITISSIKKETPNSNLGLNVGDTVVKINGNYYNKSNFRKVLGEPLIGRKINATVSRNGIEYTYELQYHPSSFYEKFIDLLFRIVPVTLMLIYILVGFWGLFKSPYSKETITIAMFCFAFGSFMFTTISFSTEVDTFVSKYLYFKEIKTGVLILALMATSFWVLLFATFPRRSVFFDNNKFLSYTFIFLLPIVFVISIVFKIQLSAYIVSSLISINMGLGVFLLRSNVKKATSALEQRQLRLMFLGINYGAMSISIGWISALVGQFLLAHETVYEYGSLTIFLLGQIGGLIIPLTFLNSFFQNRLLETESALRRRIRYIGVTLAMLVLYLSVIFLVGRMWINMFNVTDPTLIIILVLFVSLTFTPFNKKILKWLDEKFYPEKTKYKEALSQFIQNASGYLESGELLHHFSDWARNTTGIKKVIPVTADYPPAMNIPFRQNDSSDSILNTIKNGNKFFWDEIGERSKTTVNNDEFEWAKDNEISVSIPMLSRGELIGVLNVGRKLHEDDFTSEDLDILTQASTQTALALQNIKLQSEYIEKKRIDKELSMARNIQQRLMPQVIPHVPGMEVIGECHPCNEIAGDYFDIINIEGNYTVMVVADVSGKGAGAAMIMANLQASIRLGVHLSDKLADFVSRINDLIYNNTSPSEFITFFMAIWDPGQKTLFYVNAGHNPPIVVEPDGTVVRLPASGLILGVLENQVYEEKYIRPKPGSVFVIYTDGLEEALNDNDEIFGDKRIIDVIKQNIDRTPEDIIQSLSDGVLKFCHGRRLHDDVTLIVGKVNL